MDVFMGLVEALDLNEQAKSNSSVPDRVSEFANAWDQLKKERSKNPSTIGAKLDYWFDNGENFIVVLRLNEIDSRNGKEVTGWTVCRVDKSSSQRECELIRPDKGNGWMRTRHQAIDLANANRI